MRMARARVKLPIFAMIRPRAGNFVCAPHELVQMHSDIAMARRMGMDGIVLGVLTRDRRVDIAGTRELLKAAEALPVTFHRAFDEAANLDIALQDVIETGAARILTSGGATAAPAGIERLAHLVAAASDSILVLPGGGINASKAL